MNTGNYSIDHAESILYNDGEVIIADLGDGTGRVYVYKVTEYKTPLYGRNVRGWLCCGAWKRVICGYREVDVWDARTVRDIDGIAAAVKS